MVSVVVPVYNEEKLIKRLVTELLAAMEGIDLPWEAIFVNDGSSDATLPRLRAEQNEDERLVVVDLSRNWGHQAALSAGLSQARGDAVVLMDGDLQDPPCVIPKLVAAWKGGADVVVAERRSRIERGPRRWLFPLFYRVFSFVSDFPIPLNAGIFGLLDRKAVDAVNRLPETNRYLPGLRSWIGYSTTVVWYDRAERAAGEPKQSLSRLFKYALDAMFSFSYKPLRLSLALGFTLACFALTYGLLLFLLRTLGVGMFGIPVVDGYTSTIVSILLLGAVQLISVGILGEYLARVYDEVKRRPLFLIRGIYGRRARS